MTTTPNDTTPGGETSSSSTAGSGSSSSAAGSAGTSPTSAVRPAGRGHPPSNGVRGTSRDGHAMQSDEVDRRSATASALEALRCEQELIDCRHGERGELLLDAACNWFQAGHVERATELFTEARLFGGDAGRTAQLQLAMIAFHRGDDCEALGTLRGLATADLDPFDLVSGGDLLREHGEPKEAIGWYDRVLDGYTAQELGHPDCPWVVRTAVTGRAHARADLGLPPDPIDRTAPTLPTPAPNTPRDRIPERAKPERAKGEAAAADGTGPQRDMRERDLAERDTPEQVGLERVGPEQTKPEGPGPRRTGPQEVEPERVEPERVEPERVEPERVGLDGDRLDVDEVPLREAS